MFKEKFFKSLIGSKVKVSVLDYEGEFVVDKELSIFSKDDYEYYSSVNFILVDHEIISDINILYMEVVE
jgi:hypothetical protein